MDPIIQLGVLFLGFCFLLYKSYVIVDNASMTLALMVTFVDASVQVHFIPAPPVPYAGPRFTSATIFYTESDACMAF